MIKLIVTDMDGCLLDGKGSLPSDFEETYRIIEEKGVILAAASGRSIAGLMKPLECMLRKWHLHLTTVHVFIIKAGNYSQVH